MNQISKFARLISANFEPTPGKPRPVTDGDGRAEVFALADGRPYWFWTDGSIRHYPLHMRNTRKVKKLKRLLKREYKNTGLADASTMVV